MHGARGVSKLRMKPGQHVEMCGPHGETKTHIRKHVPVLPSANNTHDTQYTIKGSSMELELVGAIKKHEANDGRRPTLKSAGFCFVSVSATVVD